MDKSLILAIETSCDETSIAILKDGKDLLANIVSTQIETHKQFGGVMPEVASRLHVENITVCIDEAIKKKLKGRVIIDGYNFIRLLPLTPATVRIPDYLETPRPMEFIHTEEVSLAMIQIIKHSFGLATEDLATECARVFGFERKGPRIKAKTDAAIQYLIKQNVIKVIDGKVQLIGDLS